MSTPPALEDPELGAFLAEIAEEAAGLILPLWKSGLTVDAKADDSPVTEADRRAETLILERLAAAWPDTPVISEEYASAFGTPESIVARFFLVDPLDGTKAFVRGDPSFTVNIGLVVDGAPVAGAVVAPASAETWATGPDGAFKRDASGQRRITVRAWPKGQAVALVSHTMKPEIQAQLKTKLGVAATRPMDSSIKFCRIAEGSADVYPRGGPTMEWDIAAGHAVLVAAGGRVETEDGAPFVYGKAAAGFRNGPFVARGR